MDETIEVAVEAALEPRAKELEEMFIEEELEGLVQSLDAGTEDVRPEIRTVRDHLGASPDVDEIPHDRDLAPVVRKKLAKLLRSRT